MRFVVVDWLGLLLLTGWVHFFLTETQTAKKCLYIVFLAKHKQTNQINSQIMRISSKGKRAIGGCKDLCHMCKRMAMPPGSQTSENDFRPCNLSKDTKKGDEL